MLVYAEKIIAELLGNYNSSLWNMFRLKRQDAMTEI